MGRAKAALSLLLPPAFWLGVWQLAAMGVDRWVEGRGNRLLLPYPADVAAALVRLAGDPQFWGTAAASLGRVFAGMAAGTLLGALAAVCTHSSRWCDRLLSPALRVIRATPVASFIILVLLWVGRDLVPSVIAALMVLPVVWANTARGLDETDPRLLELARAYRFSRWKAWRLVYVPSARPYFLSGATTAMGLAWKSGVAAEVLCLPRRAVGTQIYNTKLYLEIPELFAWTAAVILLSLLMERALAWALSRRGGGAP